MPNRYSIVGEKWHPGASELLRALSPGAPVVLVRDPGNRFDKNAVAVYVYGALVGFIPKANNVALAAFIDQHGRDHDVDVIAQDGASHVENRKAIDGKFAISPNSAFPQVEV